MSILKKLRQRKERREFEKFVSPEVIKLLNKPVPAGWAPTTEKKHFQFIVVQVDETRPDEVPALAGKVVDAFLRHGAIVSGTSSSLIVGYFGVPFPKDDSPESRLHLVNALLAENGSSVRVAHGQCEGLVGSLGSKDHYHWGAIIPNFSGILKKLLASPFGTAIEVLG